MTLKERSLIMSKSDSLSLCYIVVVWFKRIYICNLINKEKGIFIFTTTPNKKKHNTKTSFNQF